MALCGGGCMGFVNVATASRAIGYLERDPLPAGPVALVTHSGSAFSALLRTHRRLGYSLAVSSGQELVTTTADYLDYALDDPADAGRRAAAGDRCASPSAARGHWPGPARADVPWSCSPSGQSGGAGAGRRALRRARRRPTRPGRR